MEHDRRNIVLTGFMGTGKTTVGRLLADRLGFDFVDTDVTIEQRHGSISTIFAEQGEPTFRAIEQEIATELADRTGLVIATGGRLMLDPPNIASLGSTGRVFCLTAASEAIIERVLSDKSRVERPLLAVPDPQQRINQLLEERSAGYLRFPQVATDGRAPETIADEIACLATSDTDCLG